MYPLQSGQPPLLRLLLRGEGRAACAERGRGCVGGCCVQGPGCSSSLCPCGLDMGRWALRPRRRPGHN